MRLKSISLVRIKFGDLINGFDPTAHKMTDCMKQSSYTYFTGRDLDGCQRLILPLKIVLRCGNKSEDLLQRAINMCTYVNTDHLGFHGRQGYHPFADAACSERLTSKEKAASP